MDSNCHSSTRSIDQEHQEAPHTHFKRSTFIDNQEQTDSMNADNIYTSLSMGNGNEEFQYDSEKSSISNSYSQIQCNSLNSSEKQLILKRGRPRKYTSPRYNIYHQTVLKPKPNRKPEQGEIPSHALPRQPSNKKIQGFLKKPFIEDFPVLKKHVGPSETMRHSEISGGSRMKHDSSRRLDKALDVDTHTLCYDSQLCYPTQHQKGSAFSPARASKSYRPCCHGNIQKYNEPYYLPCYPIMIQEDRDTIYPSDTSYHNSYTNYSLENKDEVRAKPSNKNPIIIECFSLAKNGNDKEISVVGVNQARHYIDTQARYQYNHDASNKESCDPTEKILPPEQIKENQNKFNHNCTICHQTTTGEIPEMCCTPVKGNCDKCCYAIRQCNSLSSASLMRNPKEECESCWGCTGQREGAKTPSLSKVEAKMPSSPEHIVLKQEHENQQREDYLEPANNNKTQEVMTVRSAFNNVHIRDGNVLETEVAAEREEDQFSAENEYLTRREKLLDVSKQEYWPTNQTTTNSNGLSYPHLSLTNTATLYSSENLTTSESTNDLTRKWEAMYEILQGPEKSHKKSYFCIHCGRAFTHLSSLNNHIRTHTGQKPFRCRYCGKRFAQSGVLTAHLRTHTGDKPFKCVICGKRFAQTTTLANHIRTHTGQKPFSCKYCKRTFAQSSTRNKHELSHTKEKPFECKYCGRSFTQSATVMRHMRIHMRDTKYSCVHCGKTFAYLYSLDKHLDAHSQ